MDLLGSPNVYDREIAQRILSERGSASIVGKLEALVLDEKKPRPARMHGLWARVGIGPLEPGFQASLLSHGDATFRAWGVRAAGNTRKLDAKLCDHVLKLAGDSSPDVRLQVAIAATKIDGVDPLRVLLAVEQRSYEDPLIPQIVWQNLHPMLEERQYEIVRRFEKLNGRDKSFSPLAPHAIEKLLASSKPDAKVIGAILDECLWHVECREAIDLVAERFRAGITPTSFKDELRRELIKVVRESYMVLHFPNTNDCCVLLAYCGDKQGLEETRGLASRTWDGKDQEFRQKMEEVRIRALDALLFLEPLKTTRSLVEKTLGEGDASSSIAFRGKVLDTLDSRDDPELAPIILRAYPNLAAQLKPRAIELLTERPAWSKALLAAVEAKQVPTSALNVNQLRRLQKSKDPEIAKHVRTLFGTIRDRRNPSRERTVEEKKQLIRSTPGDPVAGLAVFNKLCAQCHKIHGEGQDVGPDITSNGRNDFEQLLSNVFDPSLVIGPGYQATTVATTDGRVLTGLLVEDGKERVVLKIQGGKIETIPRSQIDEMKTSSLSLMPEEMEKQFTTQEIADLFAFLCLDKPPTDPSAKPLPGAGPIRRR